MKPLSHLGIFLLFLAQFSFAQDFSNKGKEFWIAYPAHLDGTGSVMGIYLTSDQNTSGQVNAAGNIIPFTISANQVTRIFLGGAGNPTNANVYLDMQDGTKTNAAIRVTASANIVVYTHIIRSARSGATLTLPTNVLGTEYTITGFPSVSSFNATGNGSQGGISQFTVVATQPNTQIEVQPTAAGIAGRPAGTPFFVTLANAGDCYQFQGLSRSDLSGTLVRSVASGSGGCKPIAVFAGSTWSNLDCSNGGTGDNLFQQLFPNRSWGKQFITAPFKNRPYDVYRIYVQDPTTVVQYTENGVTRNFNATQYNTGGRFYQYSSSAPMHISADKPIQVVQFITSQPCQAGCGTGNNLPSYCWADPEMVILSPVEQSLNDVTFFSAHENYVPAGQTSVKLHFVNIVIPKKFSGSVRIDGASPTGIFTDIPGTNYAYLQEDLSSSSALNPVHRVTADSSFSAIVYGYGNVESYGYNGGTNVKDLFQFVSITNRNATVDFPATCTGTPFNFSITLPYQPTKLNWDFSGLFNNVTNEQPVADSSYTLQGKTLYVYKLPETYQVNNKGTYPVRVIVNNPTGDGCTGEQTIDFELSVFDPPTADFSYVSDGCVGTAVQFTATGNTGGRPISKYYWDFGDGSYGFSSNPSKTYAQPGKYLVKLVLLTDAGCSSDTVYRDIELTGIPVAGFQPSGPECEGQAISFTDVSSLTGFGSIKNWSWNMGNGSVYDNPTGISVTGIYPAAGNFQVTLQVSSHTGCRSNPTTQTIRIHEPPSADFSAGFACLPKGELPFTDLSDHADPAQKPFRYQWDFGDPASGALNFSDQASPLHRYSNTGTYQVKLVITSASGCRDSVSRQVSGIYPAPIPEFSAPAEVCEDITFNIQDLTDGISHVLTKWEWSFSDGTISDLQNPAKSFAGPGTYTASLKVTTSQTCESAPISKTIIVNPAPGAAFSTIGPACEKNELVLDDASVAGTGNLVRWFWDLGDGRQVTSTTKTQVTHNYVTWGDKTVKLLVENSKGCSSDTLSRTIRVNPLPQPGFILPELCLNDAQGVFTDTTSIADGTNSELTYRWRFNDGTVPVSPGPAPAFSTSRNPVVAFRNFGNYQVSLTVSSAAGCVDSVSRAFTVNGANPKASFSILPVNGNCSNLPVEIKNQSSVDFGNITRIQVYWDYDNQPTRFETDENPVPDKIYRHQYPDFQSPLTKTYRIRFRAFSGISCMTDEVQTITINASPRIRFNPLAGICLDALPRQLSEATEIGGLVGTGVYSGPGVNASGLFQPVIAGEGIHSIQYRFIADNGCSTTAEQPVEVWPRPVADFNQLQPSCERNITGFVDQSVPHSGGITQWEWNFGDGSPLQTLASGAQPQHLYGATGNYDVGLRVTNDRNCSSSVTHKTITVNPLPKVDFSLPTVCLPEGRAVFLDQSSIADGSETQFRYHWEFGDVYARPLGSDSSNQKDPVYYYRNQASYRVKLVVHSNQQCVDSLEKTLTEIYPQPKAVFSATDSLCAGGELAFTDQSNGNGSAIRNWNWTFGDGGQSQVSNPVYQFRRGGFFTTSLHIVTDKGCISDTMTRSIRVWDYPLVSAGPDITMLQDGTRKISDARASGEGLLYNWTPNTWLDNVNILNPTIIRPQNDISYRLTVTGRGGCTSSDDLFVRILKTPRPPNTFTPNGDGINDYWEINYLSDYPGCIVEVYNTAGTLLFRSVGYSRPWDGTHNGQKLPAGTYYYVIDPKNGRSRMAGYITIIR